MYDYDSVIGNDKIIKSLKLAVDNNRVNHAYIFDGPKGSGKHLIANIFAKTLNCERGEDSPCGECISCQTFESGNNPDIIYVRRKEGDREIKVDTVRNVINKNIEVKPYRNRYKVFIIEDADTMNTAAQNAFLKTLEEPPGYAVFLLLAENYNKLLVTVLSRCQRFKMQSIPSPVIKDYLTLNKGIGAENAQLAALYSQGSIGKAMELSASEEFNSLRKAVMDTTVKLLETDLIGMYELAASAEEYKDSVDAFLDIMYLLYRDCLVYKQTGRNELLIQGDNIDVIKRICGILDTRRLIRGCELIGNAAEAIRRRGDFQLVIEDLFFKLKEK